MRRRITGVMVNRSRGPRVKVVGLAREICYARWLDLTKIVLGPGEQVAFTVEATTGTRRGAIMAIRLYPSDNYIIVGRDGIYMDIPYRTWMKFTGVELGMKPFYFKLKVACW